MLGICLRMQLFSNNSEEGNVKGLGWIDAEVKKLKVRDSLKYKIPNIGWNQIEFTKESLIKYIKTFSRIILSIIIWVFYHNSIKMEEN